MKRLNAFVASATLGLNEYNTLELAIELNGDGWGIIFCSPVLCIKNDHECRENYAGNFIMKALEVVGVKSLDQMKGKPVRAIFEKNGHCGDTLLGLQHFTDSRSYIFRHKDFAAKVDIKELEED